MCQGVLRLSVLIFGPLNDVDRMTPQLSRTYFTLSKNQTMTEACKNVGKFGKISIFSSDLSSQIPPAFLWVFSEISIVIHLPEAPNSRSSSIESRRREGVKASNYTPLIAGWFIMGNPKTMAGWFGSTPKSMETHKLTCAWYVGNFREWSTG